MNVVREALTVLKKILFGTYSNGSPANGEVWFDGADFCYRKNGTTYKVPSVQVKSKTASQSVNNSTTLTNDNHLSFAVAANKTYRFVGQLYATWTTGAFKYAFAVPSGATGKCWLERGASVNNVGGVVDLTTGGSTSATNLTNAPLLVSGYIDNGSNAGTLQFQFAQSSQQANNTSLLQGSTIWLYEV